MDIAKNDYNKDFYAPIALFVFDRPLHTKKVVEHLKENIGSELSELYIFSDASRNIQTSKGVQDVREYIKTISGFRSLTIIEREHNFGLAKNIQDGVSFLCKTKGRVIVLEDDLLTSKTFLLFMNSALERYKNEKKVWHISGWNYSFPSRNSSDAYFWRIMNCWGWATWHDRWVHYKKDPQELMSWDSKKKKRFNLDGNYDFFIQVEDNYYKKKNTWAIFWYATIFDNHGLCLNPKNTMVKNIGLDGSGENCGDRDIFNSQLHELSQYIWPYEIEEDTKTVADIIEFYKKITPSKIRLLAYKIKKAILK